MALKSISMISALSIFAMMLLASFPVYAQITTPCTTSMLTSFTPCMNFITSSSNNGSNSISPSADCCNVLQTVMGNGSNCLCLIATGSVPFNIPINRSLALSLPSACNMPNVPLQCKATVAPAPSPVPLASSPAASPVSAPSPSASNGPLDGSPILAPDATTNPALSPPTTTTPSGTPPSNAGSRQSVNPPSSASTKSFSPMLVLTLIGAVALKNY
ncbi:OLC1v1019992C1 [Oldenlandia corymbosa var. corymbosa]|uniref:OLC1v1019992C1 n=1 Tax=Oldenlandia corymbosa var. corymbosa TaxID=529605 RepID=A0AAV1EFB3_OLDCO|nr:OLC1v1019992C1 [Oldenlandia corymbosa var. corymbosa]